MTFTSRLLAASAASVFLTAGLHAQSAQRYSIQASGLAVSTFGKAYDGLKAGPGFEAQFRITPSVWSFGFGIQGSTHSFDDADLSGKNVTLAGAFFEPRRVVDVGSSQVAPYVSARLAYLRQSIDIDVGGTNVYASAGGAEINGGGGVLTRLSPRVNLDLGATFVLIKFGDVELEAAGYGTTKIDGSSGNGSNLVLRLGLAVGLR